MNKRWNRCLNPVLAAAIFVVAVAWLRASSDPAAPPMSSSTPIERPSANAGTTHGSRLQSLALNTSPPGPAALTGPANPPPARPNPSPKPAPPAGTTPPLPLPRNPILPGADPHALLHNRTFWIYPTRGDGRPDRFFAFSSTNLTHWVQHGPVLSLDEVAWIPEDGAPRHYAWAPSVLHHRGRWYFYYSVGPQNPTPSRIGVAVGDNPAGPFHDSGRPLLTGSADFEAIDPMVFADPASGKLYLYAGGSAGAKLRVFELADDPTHIAREIPVETPPFFTEGAFMHHHNGRYYLSYSHGNYRDASYSVHYATAPTPTGPWTYHGPILTSDATRKGPGHHSFLRLPDSERWLIFYHRWEGQTGNGPFHGQRWICIEPVEYNPDGTIQPIRMSGGL
jgi:beta-xylosidase